MLNFQQKRVVLSAISITLVLCISMLTMCIAGFSVGASSTNTLKTICALNLRATASSSGTVLKVLDEGATVTLLSNSTNGWAKVKVSSTTGYCSTDYLQPVSGSGITMKGKTTDDVTLRSGMGTSFTGLDVIPKGTTVSVTSNADDTWAKVTYSSKSGYVRKDYITILFTIAAQPTQSTQSSTQAPTVGFTYSNPDYSKAPNWYSYSLTDSLLDNSDESISKIIIDKTKLNLNSGEKYKLTVISTGDTPVIDNIDFRSSNSSVASVSAKGLVTAISQGEAVITATDLITGKKASCKVVVTASVEPTEAPTAKPTQAPTAAPTEAPTAKPTQAPTAAPTQAPTVKPTQAPTVAETLSISKKNISMYTNNHYLLIATSNATVIWSTSNASVAAVNQSGLVISKGAGKATITAKTSTKSVTCTVTVTDATKSVNISHRQQTIVCGKTFIASSTTSSVTWSSSNTSVATVKNGYILGVSPGSAVITVSATGGAKTMLVTVSAAAPIRFAYTSPNCATKNGTVNLMAITDKTRTAVRFKVNVNGTNKTIDATSKTTDGSTYIWKASTTFSAAGTYNVKAESKKGSTWSTCDDAATTAFVTSSTNKTTTICANRRASDEIIKLIANYEGYLSSVYDDPLTGDPTLGYGKLVFVGQQFYNNLTKNEAYAYLVQTVNNEGYASKVNSFLVSNSVKFNQQQFDALVCFVYNTGTGVLTNDDDLRSALLNCSSGSSSGTTTYYINGSYVRIRSGPGTSYDIIDELDYGTTLTIVEKTNSSWYYVKLANGTKGYVSTDYISSRVSSGSLDLNFVNKQNLINKFCQYHHANGCIYGLLYRRVDEMEVFFYNDYARNYGVYNYNIKFTCANNSSFHT